MNFPVEETFTRFLALEWVFCFILFFRVEHGAKAVSGFCDGNFTYFVVFSEGVDEVFDLG